MSEHVEPILSIVVLRISQIFEAVCVSSGHNRMGWLIPIALIHALRRWRRISLEEAVLVLATLGFLAVQMAKYSDYTPGRYPMQMLQCGVLAGFLALGEWAPRFFAKGTGIPFPPRIVLVLASCLGLALGGQHAWAAFQLNLPDGPSPIPRTLCEAMHPDALVATTKMWVVHVRCGNATIRLPRDHRGAGVMSRFLRERQPAYVLDKQRALKSHSELKEIARHGSLALYRVGDPDTEPGSVWDAPPVLACAGRSDCTEVGGRLLAP